MREAGAAAAEGGRGAGGGGGHKRRHSGGNIPMSQIEGLGRPSNPAPIPLLPGELGFHIRPFTEGMQEMIDRDVSPGVRVRSLSHPRSPSPHLLLHGGKSPYLLLDLYHVVLCTY